MFELAREELEAELRLRSCMRARERHVAARYIFGVAVLLGVLVAVHGWPVLLGLPTGFALTFHIALFRRAQKLSADEAGMALLLQAMKQHASTMGIDGTQGTDGTTGAAGTGGGEGGYVH